ncbi:hypothetical protein K435DRAFT_727234 [Dendrothele bispora CBS 962.96]|uniref:Uncharacterized protein n=1 Tax=Dendrothele bispora (strain CBS 962.96) TaxID=1314807 RepID=A0A4S8LQI7_DENBC|nr:hypothetical protein K435DRAFT_727234 [Dendrothele bispora CBS 962.96]
MPRGSSSTVDDYPSLLWITVPPVLLLSAYFARKWYLARQLRVHGIGKGAPGFQTSVRRIRVTPEIAARIRRGEEVSPDEIAKASVEMDAREEAERDGSTAPTSEGSSTSTSSSRTVTPAAPTSTNEWLPESVTNPKKRAKGKRK